jgi:hypothetical protein
VFHAGQGTEGLLDQIVARAPLLIGNKTYTASIPLFH